jgi:hypothetical protein
MKKKVQKMLEWFYQETDRGEKNISECQTIYDLVERLQYRLEDMENEHMQLIRKYDALEKKLNDIINNFPT